MPETYTIILDTPAGELRRKHVSQQGALSAAIAVMLEGVELGHGDTIRIVAHDPAFENFPKGDAS